MAVFIGRGIVIVAEVDETTGDIKGGWYDLGEVSNYAPGAQTQRLDKFTNRDGTNALVASVETQINTNLSLTIEEPNADNLRLIVRGEKVSVSSTAVTNEVLHAGTVAVGNFLVTKYPVLSGLVIKDSAGSPATLVNNTDYSVVDLTQGKIKILNLGTYVQPLKADYTRKAQTTVPVFNAGAKAWRVRIDGINLVDNAKFMAEYYRVRVNPSQSFPLIGQQFSEFVLEGAAIADTTKASDATLGQYGRIIQGL